MKIKNVFKKIGSIVPTWLFKDSLKLPDWANVGTSAAVEAGKVSICIDADTDGYVREWFQLLGVKLEDADQYWLEVAYQCAKMDLQTAITGTEYDPRVSGASAEFHFSKAPEWAQKRFRPGRGIAAASQGKEARGHYIRVRGRLPF